ncbi:MAG: glycosyltransferase family 4 protein [Demequina sp.]|nr:glycosyltransferase family 4 protein [Demequina sp.]
MRFAIVHLGRTGSGPLFALQLGRALVENGHEVVYVTSREAELNDEFVSSGTPLLALHTFRGRLGALLGSVRLPFIGRKIGHFLKTERVECVVVAMEQVWQAALPRSTYRPAPVLHVVHDAVPHAGEDGWLVRRLRSAERSRASMLVTLSGAVTAEIQSDARLRSLPVCQSVHPAFDVAVSTRPRVAPVRVPVVGFFGRMSPYKGLDLAIDAVETLRADGFPVSLHVVGSGIPAEARARLSNLDRAEDRWVPQREVEAAIKEFDAVLLPYIEASQSGVLAYASALGVPAVVTPVGGLLEQAEAFGSAVVSEDMAPASVADALRRLLSNKDLYEELSLAGLESSQRTMSWKRVAHDIADSAATLVR